MAFRVGVGQSEVIHYIWQHRPGLHTHRVESIHGICLCVFFKGFCEHVFVCILNMTLKRWSNFKLMCAKDLPHVLTLIILHNQSRC